MAQFDVFRNANSVSAVEFPFLLDIQADLLRSLATRMVVPLATETAVPHPIRHLNPVFEVEGRRLAMATPEMAGVPLAALGKPVCSLDEARGEIIAALDFLITGV